jgi:two-component system, cell cycle sensor histidine kinase and response regulator CckA
VAAKDGNEALEIFSSHADEIDLVLLDVIMPVKNGMDVYKEMQTLRPSIKVLFMSGYPYEVLSQRILVDKDIDMQ